MVRIDRIEGVGVDCAHRDAVYLHILNIMSRIGSDAVQRRRARQQSDRSCTADPSAFSGGGPDRTAAAHILDIERRGRQPGAIVQVAAERILAAGIGDLTRGRNGGGGENDLVAAQDRLRREPDSVLSGDDELLERGAWRLSRRLIRRFGAHHEALTDMVEGADDRRTRYRRPLQDRPAGHQVGVPVFVLERPEGETLSEIQFVLWMHVGRFTDVEGRCHAGMGDRQGVRLLQARIGVPTAPRRGFGRAGRRQFAPVRQHHVVERQIVHPPEPFPALHERLHLQVVAVPRLRRDLAVLALIPERAPDAVGRERKDHAVEERKRPGRQRVLAQERMQQWADRPRLPAPARGRCGCLPPKRR